MVQLYLLIDRTFYRVTPIEAQNGWRLRKKNQASYYCVQTEHGLECTCADWIFRKSRHATDCKHLKALTELKLL